MPNDIYLIGEVGFDINLDTVIESVEASNSNKPLNFFIHSSGGSVYEGLAIYNYLKGLDQEVNTISSGLVASVASIVFLAGRKETRKINETDSFLIHLPRNQGNGTAEELEKTVEELRDIEGKFSKIYAKETNITAKAAIKLMKKHEMLDVKWLKENGFVAEIVKFKAVAIYNKPKNKIKMEKKNLSKKDRKWFRGIFAKHLGDDKPNMKTVQNATGTDIDFDGLEADAVIKVGDKATIDGKKFTADHTMPSGEIWKFLDGKLEKMIPAKETKEEVIQAKFDKLVSKYAIKKEKYKNEKKANRKMLADIGEMKSKITSSFQWKGKTSKTDGNPTGEKTRTFHPKSD